MSEETFEPARILTELKALVSTWNALSLADFRTSGPRLVEVIERRLAPRYEQREAIAAWLERAPANDAATRASAATLWADDLPSALALMLIRGLHARNQFALLDDGFDPVRATIADACTKVARLLRSTDRLEALMPSLTPLVATAYDRCIGQLEEVSAKAVAPTSLKREVVCREYGSELQLELMGLEEGTLLEPILDMGCGPQAVLVRELRAREMNAVGIDRYLDVDVEFATRADWMTYPLGESRWGTIISHQGFSLHFVHHHLASEQAAAMYARRYMQILKSLRPGGRFVYTPGLPFFEKVLPPMFTIKRVPLPPPLAAAMAAGLDKALGESGAYTTHVIRG
ncbi:MAG: class I SAM-dependent methyltransferase [Polyangiaceae bacterium]